jgi:hypothetical protein
VSDAVFRPKSYLPPVPEGAAGYTALPSDVDAQLARLAAEHPEAYVRALRGVHLNSGPQDLVGFQEPANFRGPNGAQGSVWNQGNQGSAIEEFHRVLGLTRVHENARIPGLVEVIPPPPSVVWMHFEINVHYSILELEEKGGALGFPYLFLGTPDLEHPGQRQTGTLDFLRQGRFRGFHSFNMGQIPTLPSDPDSQIPFGRLASPGQRAIHAEVSYYCSACDEPINSWTRPSQNPVSVFFGLDGARCRGKIHYRADGSPDGVSGHDIPAREVRVRIDHLYILPAAFRGPR